MNEFNRHSQKVSDLGAGRGVIEGREFYRGIIGNQSLIALPPIEMDFSGCPKACRRHPTSAPSGLSRAASTRAVSKASTTSTDDLKMRMRVALGRGVTRALRVLCDYGPRVDREKVEEEEDGRWGGWGIELNFGLLFTSLFLISTLGRGQPLLPRKITGPIRRRQRAPGMPYDSW